MSWQRFSYICRKLSAEPNSQQPVGDAIARVEAGSDAAFYASKIAADGIERALLNDLAKLPSLDQARSVTGVYAKLNVHEFLEEPLQFKRVLAYLGLVTIVFYFTAAIYYLKVAPEFLAVFDEFELVAPTWVHIYQKYWAFFGFLMAGLLGSAFYLSFHIKKFFNFKRGVETSLLSRLFVFPSIRAAYCNILTLLYFPVAEARGGSSSLPNEELSKHLCLIANSDLDLVQEIKILLEIESKQLLQRCEAQLKLFSIILSLTVIFSIWNFIASAYSPIFIMGEVI